MAAIVSFVGLCLVLFLCKNAESKSLVICGGSMSESNLPVWDKIVELAGGRNAARIGVVSAASSTPADSAAYYTDWFLRMGALETYWIPVHEGNREANSDPQVVANIERMTGFFFSGGDQARIISSFYNNGRVESPALAAIKRVYNNGAVLAGSSAGAACMGSAVMVMGGYSYEALRYGAYRFGLAPGSSYLQYDEEGGIGVLDDYIVDTHYSERGREGRLLRLIWDTGLQTNGVDFGIGVDENTALVVTDVGTSSATGEVLGENGVMVQDLSGATRDNSNPDFKLSGVVFHYITEDDKINMNTHQVAFASWKTSLAGREYYDNAITSTNIFVGTRNNPGGKAEFVRIATNLFDSRLDFTTWGRTTERNPTFYVDMDQESSSRGFEGRSPLYDKSVISYSNLKIEINPSRN